MAPQQQTVDCSDPAVMNSEVCQSPRGTMLQQQQQTGTQTPTPQTTTQQGTGRDLYVDSAGYSESNETQAQKDQDQRLRRLTARPEPLTDLQKLAHQATGEWLPIFGRQLFQSAPSTFAPADQIPASPDYVLGPGDEVILRLWGHTNVNARLTVDRAGVDLCSAGGCGGCGGAAVSRSAGSPKAGVEPDVPELRSFGEPGEAAVDPGVCAGRGAGAGELYRQFAVDGVQCAAGVGWSDHGGFAAAGGAAAEREDGRGRSTCMTLC